MAGQLTLADGARLSVRPIGPHDSARLADAFSRMSDDTRHNRFLGPKPRLSSREITYLTDVDHVSHEALVAIDEPTGEIVGIGRYAKGNETGPVADIALVVVDAWQRRGIGHALCVRIVEAARRNGITRLTGTALATNLRIHRLTERLGFRATAVSGGVVELELDLAPASGAIVAEAA
jgi:RimJ/RimL family protein N-acetyltransferase